MSLKVMKMENENRTFADLLALVMVVIGMLIMMLGFNYQTVRLSLMGFSPQEINQILELDEKEQNAILEKGEMLNQETFIEVMR
jgi:hypothetical protein